MKQKLLFFLILALLLTGCTPAGPGEGEVSFRFYYRSAELSYGGLDGPMHPQIVTLQSNATALNALVHQYLSTQPERGALFPFPPDWELESAYVEGATANVRLRGPVYAIRPWDRSLMNACLARTLLQLDGILRVSILLPGMEQPEVFSGNDILLWDSTLEPQEEITLYFPDREYRYLTRSRMTVSAMEPRDKALFIMDQLLSARSLGQSYSCIPAGTVLQSLSVQDGVCTLSLSGEFMEGEPDSFAEARLAIYSIVNSLTELPQIRSVSLQVEGLPLEHYQLLELKPGLLRDESLLAAAAGSESADVTLFPVSGRSLQLVSIPLRLDPSEDQSPAQQVMEALLDYRGRDGIENPIPQGTKLLSLRLEDHVCTVDLTGEFLTRSTRSQEVLAVRSIVATMHRLEGISSVYILVEGMPPVYRDPALQYVHSPSMQWFAN